MAKWPTFFSEVPQAAQQKHSPCRGRPEETVEFTLKKEFLKESSINDYTFEHCLMNKMKSFLIDGLFPFHSSPLPKYFQPNLFDVVHCKKSLLNFPSPAGMSLIKLSLGGYNLIIPVQGEFILDGDG